jgi:hypothetical protein
LKRISIRYWELNQTTTPWTQSESSRATYKKNGNSELSGFYHSIFGFLASYRVSVFTSNCPACLMLFFIGGSATFTLGPWSCVLRRIPDKNEHCVFTRGIRGEVMICPLYRHVWESLIFSLVPSDNHNTRSTCPTSVFTGIEQMLMSRPEAVM